MNAYLLLISIYFTPGHELVAGQDTMYEASQHASYEECISAAEHRIKYNTDVKNTLKEIGRPDAVTMDVTSAVCVPLVGEVE